MSAKAADHQIAQPHGRSGDQACGEDNRQALWQVFEMAELLESLAEQ